MESYMHSFVALSGGIDSTALALIQPDAQLVFTDTGWEFPQLYAHLNKIEAVTGRTIVRLRNAKYASIPESARSSLFLPNHGARYCTRQFKIEPMNQYLAQHTPAELLIGLRADEPDRIGNTTEMDGLAIRYPLREAGMNRIDCVQLCIAHDLLPRYPVYMARGGCIGCFYKRRSEVKAMIALVPALVDELEELETEIQDERGKFFHMFPNVGMSIADLRRQPLLFDVADVYADAADKSDVGIACGLFCNR
jgi:hypothetical protein